MKTLLTITILFISLSSSAQTSDHIAKFKKMEWMIGTWKIISKDENLYRSYQRKGKTSIEMLDFLICNGDTVRDYQEMIEIRNNKISLTRGQYARELKSITDTSVLFENTKNREIYSFRKTKKAELAGSVRVDDIKIEYLMAKSKSLPEILSEPYHPAEGTYSGSYEAEGRKSNIVVKLTNLNGKQHVSLAVGPKESLQPISNACVSLPFVNITSPEGPKKIEFKLKLENDVLSGRISNGLTGTVYMLKQN